jgi:hypothetical protein
MSAESKKLTKKALHNMGSVNVLSALGTAGKAAGKWLAQPDNAALVVDTTMKVNKAIQDGKADGQAISEAGTKIEKQGQTRKSQRDIALGKIMKILGDEVILVSNIRKELLKEGIVTQEAHGKVFAMLSLRNCTKSLQCLRLQISSIKASLQPFVTKKLF